ncbi:Hpt domain-containing protein [Pseudomonas hamedanensis]|uniref:Hpt domain-containing protein n=1 Tax=Pseudomonas hamedanensis TaxID=2745504 RepID=A0A9E6TIU5_9PSED|nr:Hpt domain-containing protein [Pseudomonas hamedanensis]QXI19279.1 Hpt domain-containing protein [Pseudomonas hamedanensis]
MTDPHVDRDVLDTLREVMEDGYQELLETFLADSESRLQELQDTTSAKALSDIAHSFKGSASNMGAVWLAALCQELESNAKDKNPQALARLVAEIHKEFADVRSVYEDEKHHTHTH